MNHHHSISSISLLLLFLFISSCHSISFPNKPSNSFESEEWRLLQFSNEYFEWISIKQLNLIITLNETVSLDQYSSLPSSFAIERIRNRKGNRFIDITEEYEEGKREFHDQWKGREERNIPNYPIPNPKSHKEIINLFSKVNPSNLKQTIQDMSNLNTRYYKSQFASKSPALLRGKVETMIKHYGQSESIKVDYIINSGYDQPNLRVIIPSKAGSIHQSEIVVIGAHLDSTTMKSPASPESRSPGADDDASGSSTVLETFRLILESKWRGSRPIHFMWFAAEEAGLLGSSTVAKAYKEEGLNVYGMLQLDMTGYFKNGPQFTLMNDPNLDFTNYLASVANAYLPKVRVERSTCGYACSDHWSFDRQGYPSGLAIESNLSEMDPFIHSEKDVVDILDFNGMSNFVCLALAFSTEISR